MSWTGSYSSHAKWVQCVAVAIATALNVDTDDVEVTEMAVSLAASRRQGSETYSAHIEAQVAGNTSNQQLTDELQNSTSAFTSALSNALVLRGEFAEELSASVLLVTATPTTAAVSEAVSSSEQPSEQTDVHAYIFCGVAGLVTTLCVWLGGLFVLWCCRSADRGKSSVNSVRVMPARADKYALGSERFGPKDYTAKPVIGNTARQLTPQLAKVLPQSMNAHWAVVDKSIKCQDVPQRSGVCDIVKQHTCWLLLISTICGVACSVTILWSIT